LVWCPETVKNLCGQGYIFGWFSFFVQSNSFFTVNIRQVDLKDLRALWGWPVMINGKKKKFVIKFGSKIPSLLV
jgi:hypothetical protein